MCFGCAIAACSSTATAWARWPFPRKACAYFMAGSACFGVARERSPHASAERFPSGSARGAADAATEPVDSVGWRVWQPARANASAAAHATGTELRNEPNIVQRTEQVIYGLIGPPPDTGNRPLTLTAG